MKYCVICPAAEVTIIFHIHTVSHHDPDLTFNHSFIEPPSSGWVTEGSSFDSDEEQGEALYCVPPREGMNTDTPDSDGRAIADSMSSSDAGLFSPLGRH